MALDPLEPVVIKMNVPDAPDPIKKFPGLPHFTDKSNKILVALAAIVICVTMVAFVIFSLLANNQSFKDKRGLDLQPKKLPAQTSTTTLSQNALPGGGIATGSGGSSGTNAPQITLTADPASTKVGNAVTLTWKVTNNPKSCTSSDDWAAGTKASSGSEKTQAFTKVQTYLFTLTCKTDTGTSFSTVRVGSVGITSTGSAAARPHVTLAATPAGIYTGQLSSLSWNVSNNPTACSASGDWSGNKAAVGSQSTGVLTNARTYTYKLTCSNGGGSETVTATVSVKDAPPGVPVILIYGLPVSPVNRGTNVTITWEVTNKPKTCTSSGNWSGTKSSSGSFQTGALNTLGDYAYKLTCTDSSGLNPTDQTADVSVVLPAPVVSLTASPTNLLLGGSSTLTWSATNNPTFCTASNSWSGTKPSSGSQSTGALNTAKSYGYNLKCVNAGGSNEVANVPVNVSLPPPPVVSISVAKSILTTSEGTTLNWSATNNPTSCQAKDSWTGTKSSSGSLPIGPYAAGSYKFTLSCTNAGGTGSSNVNITVSSGSSSSAPVVTISVIPAQIGTGSSSTISWSGSNTPTSCTASGSWSGSKAASGSQSTGVINIAGSYTYTMSCSNSAGTGSASATLTVIAIPGVTVSLNPTSITAGGSSTISWSVTNSPGSCTAGGSWSGSKGTSGSQSTGAINTSGSYTYSLSCTNSGGTGSGQSVLTVNPAVAVYCNGNSPCYGRSEMSAHNTATNCWAYNINRAVNITTLNNGFHKGRYGNLLPTNYTGICGNVNLASFLSGGTSIQGIGSHGHSSAAKNNTSSQVTPFFVGYYDAAKP